MVLRWIAGHVALSQLDDEERAWAEWDRRQREARRLKRSLAMPPLRRRAAAAAPSPAARRVASKAAKTLAR